jgi:hypothetical protein
MDKGKPHPFRKKPAATPAPFRGSTGSSSLVQSRSNLLKRREQIKSPAARRTGKSRLRAQGVRYK